MRQTGNAVPVRLAEKIGRQVIAALDGGHKTASLGNVVYPKRVQTVERMRLAIEKRKVYKGSEKGGTCLLH